MPKMIVSIDGVVIKEVELAKGAHRARAPSLQRHRDRQPGGQR